MQSPNDPDPIVEVLQRAYRRGLAVQREQAEKNQTVNMKPSEAEKAKGKEKLTQPAPAS